MDVWLKPVFADLVENNKFSDCRILVENEGFDCHKVILASSSEFFERLFLSSFRESKSGEIRLNEVKPEIFAKFIQYVYTYSKEKLEQYSNSIIMELLSCGTRWLVNSIVSECVTILKGRAHNMLLSDLVELFQHSHSINNKELIDIAVKFMRSRFSTALNCYDVLVLTSDVFEQYTIMTEGYLPEIERFKMVEAYVTVNGLIDIDPAETSEEGVEEKKEGDSGIGEMVVAKASPDDIEQEVPENDDDDDEGDDDEGDDDEGDDDEEPDEKGEDGAKNPGTVEPKDSKIKVLHSKYIQTLLGYVKFNKMSKNEFYNIVGKSQLLSLKEKFENLYLTQ